MVVLLLQFALPSWAAFSARGKAGWIEVCAAGGIQWVKLASTDKAVADDGHLSSGHCLLCASTGSLADFDVRLYLGDRCSELPIRFFSEQAGGGFAGHAILSRAPPLIL
jgi:hypothetical protein